MNADVEAGVCLATTAAQPGGVWRHICDLADGYTLRGVPVRVDLPVGANRLRADARARGYRTDPMRFRHEVYHAHLADTYDRAMTVALGRARAMGAAVVITEHLPRSDASDRRLADRPGRRGARLVKSSLKAAQFALADRVIAVSSGSEAFLRERYGLSRHKLVTVFNGVRSETPGPERARPVGAGGWPSMVSTGSVIRQKGFDVLVAAAALARRDWRVDVYGTGPHLTELAESAGAERLSDGEPRVVFHGWTDDVRLRVTNADALVMASRWEAMPYSALEAMSWSRPVIATAVDGLTDLVEPDVTGVLVPPENAAALAAALDVFGTDPGRAARLGDGGLARVSARFGLDAMVAQTVEVYQQALRRIKVALRA